MTAQAGPFRVDLLGPDEGPPMGVFARALRTGVGEPLAFLPALPQSEANARQLADPRAPALAVVTGQQPGLFGGPLLTFHKAAGAIALARKLDGIDGRRVVPVFWLASEDQDFDEANRALVVDRMGQARTLQLEMEGDGRSLMDLDVPTALSDQALENLRAALPDTERGRLAADLAARRPGEDFPTWCVRILVSVFGDSGLVVVEPPVLAPWMGAPLAWLLDNAEAIRSAVEEAGAALSAAGLPAPLWPQEEGATALFYREEAGGRRLRVDLEDDGTVRLRGEAAPFTRAELADLLRAEPLRGSGNVIGRVFVQNQLLPALAYVAGPTEIAYHAQVRRAHEALGLFFPLAVPRPVASWVDAKAERTAEVFGCAIGDVLGGRAQAPATRDAEIDAGLAAGARLMAEPPPEIEALLARGGQGAQATSRALARLAATWEKAARGVRAGFEADAGVGRARWERLQAELRPRGRPQGRVLSALSLIARHGLAPVRAGLLSLDPLPLGHHLVRLGEEFAP